MGEENSTEKECAATPEEPSAKPPAHEVQGPAGVPWSQPGHIPEPKEKNWDAEPVDPYEGIERRDPFEGRPKTAVPDGFDATMDQSDPGQPLHDKKRER